MLANKFITPAASLALACCCAVTSLPARAQGVLLAKGSLTGSTAGAYKDLSKLPETLENGVAANLLGGLGSGISYLSGDTFLAVPDRGPNAVPFNPQLDDTVAYINRFHTIKMNLTPAVAGTLPFSITPTLQATTLLHSFLPLSYDGANVDGPSGVPPENRFFDNYFVGRSDAFNPEQISRDFLDARLDPEGIRISNDGKTIFISDEYGPYIYQFLRSNGQRVNAFTLPYEWYVPHVAATGAVEIADNTSGRVANKGAEGLAITPDGKTLVAILQNSLIQDAAEGGEAAKVLRIATIDIASGQPTNEYAYLLTAGTGVSELTALNNHEFLVDERDGKGLGDGSKAKVKQLFKIDLATAQSVAYLNGTQAAARAVKKTLFLDIVQILTANGFTASTIPAKIEGVSFGPDVQYNGTTTHTLWVANDNDFLQDYSGPNTNPNQFFVFGMTDADLGGSTYVPQVISATK